jgi:hypothetical protein
MPCSGFLVLAASRPQRLMVLSGLGTAGSILGAVVAAFTLASAVVAFGVWPSDPPGVERTALTLSPVEVPARDRVDRKPLEVASTPSASTGAAAEAPAGGSGAAAGGQQERPAAGSGAGDSSPPSAGAPDGEARGNAPVAKTPLPTTASADRGPLSGLGRTLDQTTSALGSTLRSVTGDLGNGLAPLSRGLGTIVVKAGDGLASTVEKLGAALAALLGHVPAR